MMSKRDMIAGLALVGVLAGCERSPDITQTPTETSATENADEPRLTPVDAPEETVLGAIAYADIEAELEAGGGCHVEQDGKNLLTAVESDAIAKPYGTVRHFVFTPATDSDKSAFDALWGGGGFTAGAITITVVPSEGEGEQVEEVTIRDARVTFAEQGQPPQRTIAATWNCGS